MGQAKRRDLNFEADWVEVVYDGESLCIHLYQDEPADLWWPKILEELFNEAMDDIDNPTDKKRWFIDEDVE